MPRFILSRLAQGLLVLWSVVTLVFLVTRVIGDPATIQLPPTSTAAQREAYDAGLGLNRPLPVQYIDFLSHAIRGDFGESIRLREPALSVVLTYLPATIELVFVGIAGALLFAVIFGTLAAVRPGWADKSIVSASLLGISMPQFWLGLVLIVVFGVGLRWFPVSGLGGPSYIVLPAITLGLPTAGRLTMLIRSSMIDELNAPYMLTADAKGLSVSRQVIVHGLRNALTSAVGLAGWELAVAIAGYDVVVEVVFGWTGIGHLAIDSIMGQDIFTLQALVMVVAVIIVLINIGTEIVFQWLDPEVRIS